MILKIDNRETCVIQCINNILSAHSFQINILIEQLPLGDMILYTSDNKELVIFERKSIQDLLASIKDGRYQEQSFRLCNQSIPNRQIVYIIEGQIPRSYSESQRQMVHSAICSLQLFKGFSILRTTSPDDTSQMILRYAEKISKELKKQNTFYDESHLQRSEPSYSNVVSCVKKDNITIENIGEIMLMQIPGVSRNIAISIMKKHKTIIDLIVDMQENDNCLEGIYIESTNQRRKISKTAVQNVKKYLVQNQIQEIIDDAPPLINSTDSHTDTSFVIIQDLSLNI